MGIAETISVLRNMELFVRTDERQLRAVAMMGDYLHYRAGERLFEQGDEGDAAFVLIDGSVDVVVRADGTEQAVATIGKGEIFGELAVICDQPRTSAIVARDELTVLRLNRDTVLTMLREFPDISLQMLRIISRRLERTTAELARARDG